jgi:hypothetical protein
MSTLLSAYIFKHRVEKEALQLAKVGKIDQSQATSAKTLAMANLPLEKDLSFLHKFFPDGQRICYTLAVPDLIIIAAVCTQGYP